MKKIFSKSFAAVLALLLIVASFSIATSADETTDAQEEKHLTDEEIADLLGEDATEGSTLAKYETYLETNGKKAKGDSSAETTVALTVETNPVTFEVQIPETGYYDLGFSYRALARDTIMFSAAIDGTVPFAEAEKLTLYGIYQNENDALYREDGFGNQFAPKQVLEDEFYFDTVKDITKWSADSYYFYLTAGTHTVTLTPKKGSFEIESVRLSMPASAKKYSKPSSSEYYDGDRIIMEGESAVRKTSYWLAAKSDNASMDITPHDATKILANYIGGGNWKTSGETIIWKTPNLKKGYYKIGFSYRQSTVLGAKVYRSMKIDGETQFKEMENVGFSYSYDWQHTFFANKNNDPYLIYIPTDGVHEISLEVVPGEVEKARNDIKKAVADLGELYVDMTMITGETVDIYRDYKLFEQIPNMQKRLKSIYFTLDEAAKELKTITGENSGSYISVIGNMMQICKLMFQNKYTAHRYKSEYYAKYTSLASVLYEMSSMPLDLDRIVLCSPSEEKPFVRANFFQKVGFSAQKFFMSFVQDYNTISGDSDSKVTVTIWVNWGRDQAQVLNELIRTEFTEKEGIGVNLQLVNASVVQAILSGKGPDCLIQHSRSEPVNLAMRGMLYDLKQFEGWEEVLDNFHDGAELPYYYKDGLYGLPDTQQFYMLFYRKDILKQIGAQVPETWDEFEETVKLLARNNLTAWLPNNTATSVAQANIGIGSINLFPSLLLQRGLDVYKDGGKATNLTSSEVVSTFKDWSDMYSSLKLPRTMDFYNRFRTGTCPIGVSTYTLYTTLKAAAPEIDGLWDVALVPGTRKEDGTVDHTTSGGGSACSILKLSENPESAWKFLRWWVSADTQLAYSSEVESILGPTGRVSVSNEAAFKSLEWDDEMKDVIFQSYDNTREIPEYPGSYYVSRSVYQAFWNVVENNQNPKDTLLKFAEEADREIARKWKQYENR